MAGVHVRIIWRVTHLLGCARELLVLLVHSWRHLLVVLLWVVTVLHCVASVGGKDGLFIGRCLRRTPSVAELFKLVAVNIRLDASRTDSVWE